MRLSDAIAMGRVTITELLAGELRGCALGMAANAVGIRQNYSELEDKWPWLLNRSAGCPAWPCVEREVYLCEDFTNIVGHLFDAHLLRDDAEECMNQPWTLDQLIDWVRSVEPPEQPAPQIEQAVAAMQKAPLVR